MADKIKIPGEFDDDNDFWKHPFYDRWESNRLGVVRHVVNKKDLGNLNKMGYLLINVSDKGIKKTYQKHRFIYECFFGLITDTKLVIDHKNNIKTDNRLDNLQLITRSKNVKKDYPKVLKERESIPIRAIKIDTSESIDYDSINKCCKDLDIHMESIRYVLKGITNTATSKKNKNKYTFEKLNCETDTSSVKVKATKITTGETKEYDSISECSRSLDITREAIRLVLKGQQKTASNRKDKLKYTFEKI